MMDERVAIWELRNLSLVLERRLCMRVSSGGDSGDMITALLEICVWPRV